MRSLPGQRRTEGRLSGHREGGAVRPFFLRGRKQWVCQRWCRAGIWAVSLAKMTLFLVVASWWGCEGKRGGAGRTFLCRRILRRSVCGCWRIVRHCLAVQSGGAAALFLSFFCCCAADFLQNIALVVSCYLFVFMALFAKSHFTFIATFAFRVPAKPVSSMFAVVAVS